MKHSCWIVQEKGTFSGVANNWIFTIGDECPHQLTTPENAITMVEYELIVVRVGLFVIPPDRKKEMFACPKHKHNLGRNWRPLRTLWYPPHSFYQLANVKECSLKLSFGITLVQVNILLDNTLRFPFFKEQGFGTVGYCVALGVFCVRGPGFDDQVWLQILSV